jgi:hypothetical protein
METVLQEQQVELLAVEQDLETDLSIEEGSGLEIAQSSRLSMVDKKPVLEHDCNFPLAYFHSEEEDQEQTEDSEDLSSQEVNRYLKRTMPDYLISLMIQRR